MSITNDRQYRITRAQLARFQQALATAEHDPSAPRSVQESIAHDILVEQARAQADDLRSQLEEYETLVGSQRMTLEIHSLLELPSALIHARLASGLTQRDLAERIGVTQQQVQRDEQTDYAQASLERLQKVWDVLGARLYGRVTLSPQRKSTVESSSGECEDAPEVMEVDLFPPAESGIRG